MAVAISFLEEGGQKATDVAQRLVEFLAAARTSLHFAIYDFRLSDSIAEPIRRVLQERAAAGVEVRIAYDAGKPNVPFQIARADPAPTGTSAFVSRLGSGIVSKPITGGDATMPKLMHHKYIIRDGHTPGGAIWTGSTNFTDDAWTLQENNIVTIDSPELCVFYENDFAELWELGDIATTGTHDTGSVRAGTTQMTVSFAPGEGRSIDHEIAHYISTARQRLKICSMLITSGSIIGALGDALHHGRVKEFDGVYDRTQMEGVMEQWQGGHAEWKIKAFEDITRNFAGKRSTPYTPGGKHDFMHNKILVADDSVITGSYNLSNSATLNAENVVMIHDGEIAEKYCAYIDRVGKRYGEP